jgi:DNA-binding transcriptional regulator YdaS (Cro superfamily)
VGEVGYSIYGSVGMNQANHQKLIKHLQVVCKKESRRKLSIYLGIDEASICRMWCGQEIISPASLLRIHELTSIPVAELRLIVGVPFQYHLTKMKASNVKNT